MLRPATATLRPYFWAASSAMWMRLMLEAKVAMITWPRASRITCVHRLQHDPLRRRAAGGLDPDGVGEERQHALRRRAGAGARSSVGSPITGVGSNLKSAVSTIVPTGEWMAIALVSGIEWVTWMNSAVERARTGPARPAATGVQVDVACRGGASSSLPSMKPSASGEP